MKYMESGGFASNPLTRLTLGGSLVFLSGLWISAFGLYFSRMGLSPSSVVAYYRGSDETFQPARTFGSMVEVSHGHMAMMALVLLVLTHLAVFFPISRRAKTVFIVSTFASALLNELSGWLVRFVHPAFAVLKPVAFFVSQAFLLTLLVALGAYLVAARSRVSRKAEAEGSSAIATLGAEPGPAGR